MGPNTHGQTDPHAVDGCVVSRAELLAQGLSDNHIRRARERGELVALRPGLYLRDGPTGPTDVPARHRATLTAVIPLLSGQPVASHVSAAILHGLPFCHSEVPPMHITRPDARKSRRGASVRLHRAALSPVEVVQLGGLPVTSAERTVVDCAVSMPFDHGVVLADAALRRGMVTSASLRRQLDRHPQVPGARRAAAVLAFADPRSAGPGESFSRARLHQWAFPKPEVGVLVGDADGRPLGRMAFGFPGTRVLGDFDDGVDRADRDRRDAALHEAGWQVVRWSWADLRSPQSWVETLRAALPAPS